MNLECDIFALPDPISVGVKYVIPCDGPVGSSMNSIFGSQKIVVVW